MNDHPSHKWRFSDSSYYDFVCKYCGAPEGSKKALEPCPLDIGSKVSEETERNIKAIDNNIITAMMNAHKFYCD